jgi:cobalt/nickel transport system permease protein
LLQVNHPDVPIDAEAAAAEGSRRRRLRPAVVAGVVMALLVVLTPLGLLAQGTAFGEDAPEDLKNKLGLSAIPQGLNRYTDFWKNTIFPDYGFASGEHPALAYIISAVIGILVVGLVVWLIAKLIQLLVSRGGSTTETETTTSERVQT